MTDMHHHAQLVLSNYTVKMKAYWWAVSYPEGELCICNRDFNIGVLLECQFLWMKEFLLYLVP